MQFLKHPLYEKEGAFMKGEYTNRSSSRIDHDKLASVLEIELGYSRRSAETTAHDLLNFTSSNHSDLDQALQRWLVDRSDLLDICEGAFKVSDLMCSGLTYPAALIFIDWARSDPAEAAKALAARM